jgi:hypothetical protein
MHVAYESTAGTRFSNNGWKKKNCLELTQVYIFFCKNHQPKKSWDNQEGG